MREIEGLLGKGESTLVNLCSPAEQCGSLFACVHLFVCRCLYKCSCLITPAHDQVFMWVSQYSIVTNKKLKQKKKTIKPNGKMPGQVVKTSIASIKLMLLMHMWMSDGGNRKTASEDSRRMDEKKKGGARKESWQGQGGRQEGWRVAGGAMSKEVALQENLEER